MRNRYIRFFVSSTFEDMKIERNLLQEIFKQMNADYAEQGWQIDFVDLRWGISREAGLENKTMQICKEELRRCQQISPKPNFVILSGDRYGWVPLPETVPVEIYAALEMSQSERQLFNIWYYLDENYPPDGAYVLSSRCDVKLHDLDLDTFELTPVYYTDDKQWDREVVQSLSKMYERNGCKLYGISATEQEIELGALSLDDAQDHVVAYMRHLNDVPMEKRKTFLEPDKKDNLKSLKTRITKKLSDKNIFSVNLNYDEYVSPQYAIKFKDKMTFHLRAVIERAIDEVRGEVNDENQHHIDYALQESAEFIGREDELERIKEYIKSKETDYGLWYQADSGMGKSALLAKIVETYKDDYDVICRFCGATELSSNSEYLFSSIYEDICKLGYGNGEPKRDKILASPFKDFRTKQFSLKLSKTPFSRPVLIVIDSLDRVDDSSWQEFSTLQWLDHGGRNDVKIVISSTPELKYRIELPFLRKVKLGNLGDDAPTLINAQLKKANRRLCERQMQQLSNLVEKSNKSPLYLITLGNIIAGLDSRQDISELPHTLDSLVQYYCTKLASPNKHGYQLVSHIIFWLATSNNGVVENDIAKMLSCDEVYIENLKANSMHELDNSEDGIVVPPIIWTRLRYDLDPLLRNENKYKIQWITFFHPRIKQAVLRMFDDHQNDSDYLYHLLYKYYLKSYPNRQALLEGPHYLTCGYRRGLVARQEFLHHMECNLDYIVNKKLCFPRLLMEDYDIAISCIKDHDARKRLKQTKDRMHSVTGCYSPDDVKMFLRNMPVSSPLRYAVEQTSEASSYMEDILPYAPTDESIYVLSNIGQSPVMSDDGKIVASLKENSFSLNVEYLEESDKNLRFSFPVQVKELHMDDRAHYIAARCEEECYLLDLQAKKVRTSFKIAKDSWISLAANGSLLLVGDSSCHIRKYDIFTGQMSNFQNMHHCKVSPSGIYIWFIHKKDYSLCRFNLKTEKYITFLQLPYRMYKNHNPMEENEVRIVSCSDDWCIAGNVFIIHYISDDGKVLFKTFDIQEGPALPKQHQSMFVCRDVPMWIDADATCRFLDDNYKVNNLGNTVLDNLQCLNSDFTVALSAPQGRIFNFLNEIKRFKSTKRDPLLNITGFNLSVSHDGSEIAVSTYGGYGHFGDVNLLMLRASKGHVYSWSPIPEDRRNYMSLPSNTLSPDGKILAVSVYTSNDIYLIDTDTNSLLHTLCLPEGNIIFGDNIGKMAFSQDADYLCILTGSYITPVSGPGPNAFVYDVKRGHLIEVVSNVDNLDCISVDYKDLVLSSCNRYLCLDSLIYDVIEKRLVAEADSDKEEWDRSHFNIASPSTPDIYAGANHFNFNTHKLTIIEENKHLCAISPSGLYYYYVENGKLYMCKLHEFDKKVYLRDKVVKVFPALDDRYIYITDITAHYILYDTLTHQDLQIATKGIVEHTGRLGIKVCAKGLVVYNANHSTLSLFEPDKKYGVNKPAFASFIRRWDLDEIVRKEATAVCPMCGKLIDYEDFYFCELKEYSPLHVNTSDWDDSKLKNHHCPHCEAEIQFTPYIV